MDGKDVAKFLVERLLEMRFIVHRYNSYSTSSIYLKLDYGLSCGIRIADHPGKKKYRYRFNVIKDYEGDKVILKNGLICNFYDFNELECVLDAVQNEREKKLDRYGLEKYQKYMEEQSQTDLYKRFNQVEGEK